MIYKYIHITKNAKEPLELNILFAKDWSDFDRLKAFLINEYCAEILEQEDTGISRQCILEARGYILELGYDDLFGTYLRGDLSDNQDILYKIATDLENKTSLDPNWIKI